MKKKTIALFTALILMLSLCACGASAKSQSAPAAAPTMAADMYSGAADMAVAEESVWVEEPMEAAAPAEGFAVNGTDDTGTVTGTAGDLQVEKIIYSADTTIETTEFDATLEGLNALVKQYGGFIQSSSISGNDYSSVARGYSGGRNAWYCIRIPGKNFNTMMSGISTLGNVPYTNTYTENITSQYYDTQARLKACQKQEEVLLDMLDKAESVEDLIKIEDKLTDVRYRIESVQSSLNNWDRQVNFSTINVNVQEVKVYTPTEKLSFGQKLANAFTDGVNSLVRALESFALGLLEALPSLVLLAVIALAVTIPCVRARRKRKAKKTAAGEAVKTVVGEAIEKK